MARLGSLTNLMMFPVSYLHPYSHDKVQVPDIEDIEGVPPPYVIRTLFVYGRSRCVPHLNPPSTSRYREVCIIRQ